MFLVPEDIRRYLRALRYHQRQSWLHGGEDRIERLLKAHTITMEKGVTDYYYGSGTPLHTWLSLLDREDRLARVSQVVLDIDQLGAQERELLDQVISDANLSPA